MKQGSLNEQPGKRNVTNTRPIYHSSISHEWKFFVDNLVISAHFLVVLSLPFPLLSELFVPIL